MLIEPVRREHLESVVQLWQLVGLTRPWNDPAADFRRAIAGPSSALLGGAEDGRLISTAMVGHDGHRGWVYYLAVHPDARGRGHGKAMMAACEAWLRQRDVPKLNLMIRGDNLAVQAFYYAIGYSQDDVVVYSHRLSETNRPPSSA